MNVAMSGTVDGEPWPPLGGDIDLPDVVAAKLVAAGHAEPVGEPKIETRPARKAKTRS
jgi:hypothetical protein